MAPSVSNQRESSDQGSGQDSTPRLGAASFAQLHEYVATIRAAPVPLQTHGAPLPQRTRRSAQASSPTSSLGQTEPAAPAPGSRQAISATPHATNQPALAEFSNRLGRFAGAKLSLKVSGDESVQPTTPEKSMGSQNSTEVLQWRRAHSGGLRMIPVDSAPTANPKPKTWQTSSEGGHSLRAVSEGVPPREIGNKGNEPRRQARSPAFILGEPGSIPAVEREFATCHPGNDFAERRGSRSQRYSAQWRSVCRSPAKARPTPTFRTHRRVAKENPGNKADRGQGIIPLASKHLLLASPTTQPPIQPRISSRPTPPAFPRAMPTPRLPRPRRLPASRPRRSPPGRITTAARAKL